MRDKKDKRDKRGKKEKRKVLYDTHHKRFADYVMYTDGKERLEYKVDSVTKSIPLEKLQKQIIEAQRKFK